MTTEAPVTYFICDDATELPVAFFADPDAAIAAAIKIVIENYPGGIPSVSVYKVPYGRILTYEEGIFKDRIWNAINSWNQDEKSLLRQHCAYYDMSDDMSDED